MRNRAILALVLALCLCLCACQPSGGPTQPSASAAPDVLHVVDIRTIGGEVPEGAAYYLYEDPSMTKIYAYGQIASNGQITYMAPEDSQLTLRLENIEKIEGMEEGYDIQPTYTITGTDVHIVLSSAPVQGKDFLQPGKYYHLGDVIRDFTVTDTDGNSYTLSELLKTKKCVVLNFWYVNCPPCKSEFPFLQADYESWNQDDVAFIALSPVDTAEKVADYKANMGLTFPMGACDSNWETVFSDPAYPLLTGYPTTVIIDRYGRICLADNKPVPQAGMLKTIVEYFTADDYKQTVVRSMEQFYEELTQG